MKFELNFLKPRVLSEKENIKIDSRFTVISGLLFLIALSYFLYIPPQKSVVNPKLSVGDIIHNDIVIRKDLTIVDEEQTELNKKNALDDVIPVYQFIPDYKKNRNELINNWIDFLRSTRKQFIKNKLSVKNIKQTIEKKFGIDISEPTILYILKTNIHSRIDLEKLYDFLNRTDRSGVISSKAGIKKGRDGTIKIVLSSGQSRILKVSELYDLNELSERLKSHFRNDQKFNIKESKLLSSILLEFISVNLAFSSNLTKEEESLVLSKVNPVIIKLKKGRIILRKGDEIKKDDLKIINLIYEEEKERGKNLSLFYLILLTLGIILFFIVKLLNSWENQGVNGTKLISVTLTTLLLSVLIYRILLFILPVIMKSLSLGYNIENNIILYAIPFTFGALIIAFIFNIQSSVIYSFVNAIAGAIIGEWSFTVFLYILIGSLIVSFGIEYYQRLKRSPILKVCIFFLLPANFIFLFLFNFTESTSNPVLVLFLAGIATFSAITAPLLASFIIPLWEMLFNLVTELKLVELTNLNLPIFREMLEKAPGTYHHSQMVSSLSESAALELGLSPLLLNAMSLYHDIGKIDNPQVFTENHAIYENPHKNLTPKESAKNIISHIHNGIERAKELKLSPCISSAISQHHGTKLVRFFYDKAVENSSGTTEEVDKNLFRYPGEKPQDIENAIVMLADQVEAASKSLTSPTEDEIRNVIQKIIDSNIEEKQFDNCDRLTFKALNTIGIAFFNKLSSIYHMRISYPGFNFKEEADNDKNSK